MAASTGKAVRQAAKDADPAKVAVAAAGAAAVAAGAAVGVKAAGAKGGGALRSPRAFRLKPDEALPDGLRAVALGRIDHALDMLDGPGVDDVDFAVHEARKDLKKLRALVRLARGELGNDVYRAENAAFRDAGRRLSGVRDSQVLVETLDELKKGLPRGSATALRRELVKRRRALEAEAGGREDSAREVVSMLEAARARVEEWPLETDGFEALEPGLRRIYRDGRRRLAAAEKKPTDENLHEWRKRVKDFWHHHQLLEFTWPELMEPAAEQAHHLADLLGDDHDLAVLDAAVGEYAAPEAQPVLHEAIATRRSELQARALYLGSRLYDESPRAFSRRVAGWFESARA